MVFSPEDVVFELNKKNIKFLLLWPKSSFLFLSRPFYWAFVQIRQLHFWIMFTYDFCTLDFYLWLSWRIVFTDNEVWVYSLFLDRMMPVFNAVLPEGPKITGIEYGPLALSLAHSSFFRLCESLMLLCAEIFKVIPILLQISSKQYHTVGTHKDLCIKYQVKEKRKREADIAILKTIQ